MSEFPELSDITTPIPDPFAIDTDGDWWAIGIGRLGMIVRFVTDENVLRWLAQVHKFSPQASYLPTVAVNMALSKQGIVSNKW